MHNSLSLIFMSNPEQPHSNGAEHGPSTPQFISSPKTPCLNDGADYDPSTPIIMSTSTPKQPHFNSGGDYVPSIPPPSKPYHHPGGSRSSCNPCSCLCGCLKIFFIILFVVTLLIFLFWVTFRPQGLKLHATNAVLTQFNLTTPTNTLYYNLDVNLTIRNPNKHIGIYYDRLEPRAFYSGQRFGWSTLPKFYQGTKNTTELSVVLVGQNVIALDQGKTNALSEYNSEKGSGVYSINVEVYLGVRFKLRKLKTGTFKPKIECDLKVPMHSDGTTSASSFQTTSCGLHW